MSLQVSPHVVDVQPYEVAQPVRLQQAASQVSLHHVVHASWKPWKTAYQCSLGYYRYSRRQINFILETIIIFLTEFSGREKH